MRIELSSGRRECVNYSVVSENVGKRRVVDGVVKKEEDEVQAQALLESSP